MRGQQADTVGLLVVSNNIRNRLGEVSALPVRARAASVPKVVVSDGVVSVSEVIRAPSSDLELPAFNASTAEMQVVGQALADLMLLPELCARPPVPPTASPLGDYSRWGRTYYADPPLGGPTKRWLVVSHNHFNAASGDAICVPTTSNTSLQTDELPFIQRGFALAVCPDVLTKRRTRFDLASAERLPQLAVDEMSKVAIGLVNYLTLYREAGFVV